MYTSLCNVEMMDAYWISESMNVPSYYNHSVAEREAR